MEIFCSRKITVITIRTIQQINDCCLFRVHAHLLIENIFLYKKLITIIFRNCLVFSNIFLPIGKHKIKQLQ